jgi:hypothetical protein
MRPTVFQVGGVLYWVIQTRNPDTMILKDADSTPTVAVRKNGASVADSVTITKRSATTGIYDCSYNPASEVEGDSFTLEESATVTGTTTSSATYTQSWNVRAIRTGAVELDSATATALVDLIWDEPLTKATHNVAHSSGKRLRQTTAFQQIDSTVVDAAATTTTFVTDLDSAVDNFYNDSMLVFTDGALAGQVRAILDYVGATKTIVLEEALTSAPVNGVAFAIVSLHIHPVSQIQSGLATASALSTQAAKINKIEAATSGTVTGAGTSTEVFVGPSATLTITVDSSGNRSAVVVT